MEIFIPQNSIWFLFIIILWVLPWKGLALWIAANKKHKVWFVILLILNTIGIAEIIYIFFVAKKKPSDLIKLLNSKI
jgi:methionyl-tRNA synthetase